MYLKKYLTVFKDLRYINLADVASSGICHAEKRIESRLYWKRYIPPE